MQGRSWKVVANFTIYWMAWRAARTPGEGEWRGAGSNGRGSLPVLRFANRPCAEYFQCQLRPTSRVPRPWRHGALGIGGVLAKLAVTLSRHAAGYADARRISVSHDCVARGRDDGERA